MSRPQGEPTYLSMSCYTDDDLKVATISNLREVAQLLETESGQHRHENSSYAPYLEIAAQQLNNLAQEIEEVKAAPISGARLHQEHMDCKFEWRQIGPRAASFQIPDTTGKGTLEVSLTSVDTNDNGEVPHETWSVSIYNLPGWGISHNARITGVALDIKEVMYIAEAMAVAWLHNTRG